MKGADDVYANSAKPRTVLLERRHQTAGQPVALRQRLLEKEADHHEQEREGRQHPEDALPMDRVRHQTADDRRRRRRETVDRADQGHHLRKLASAVYIGRNSPRQEISSRRTESLHQTAEQEDVDGW